MHKGVILLVKAESRDEAISRVENFLERYGNSIVWDWYQIGGRWHNTLAPSKEFDKFTDELFADKLIDGKFLSQKIIDEFSPILEEKWRELGLKGHSPYSHNQYRMSGEDEDSYNVVKLESCLDIVKDWVKNIELEKIELWDKMLAEKEKETNNYSSLTAYYARQYANLDYRDFCFESNVYNITEEEGESIPEEIKDYWAIMVDLHN